MIRLATLPVSLFACLITLSAYAQIPGYPQVLIPTSEEFYEFPSGYETPWDEVEIFVTEKFSPNLYTLHGTHGIDRNHPDASGGRVMVLFGPDGILMVDSQNRQVGEKTLAAVREFTDAPFKILVNSHIHSDHTGANAVFAKQGAMIYAQENLRLDMINPLRPNGRPAPPLDPAAVPVATYAYDPDKPGEPAVTFRMNGEIVDFIPMMPSHTAGDTVVRFRNANAIYIEDFYRNFGYPFAAQTSGGSVRGLIDAIDLLYEISDPQTWLVPGHGTLIKREDLLPYRTMVDDIWNKVASMREEGSSLTQILAANLTAPYEANTNGNTQQSKDRFITAIYNELQNFPTVVNGRRAMPSR